MSQTKLLPLAFLIFAACTSAAHPIGTAATSGSTSARASSSGTPSSNGASSSGSSGTTTGGSTSGGTSTGPALDGGCLGDGRGGTDLSPCLADDDCACPFQCTSGHCARACATASDCPPRFESCQDGICAVATCSQLGAPCPLEGASDGTCGVSSGGLVCLEDGTAPIEGACDLSATRSDRSGLCPSGEQCFGTPDGGQCRVLCTPSAGDHAGCPAGEGCAALAVLNGVFADVGACFPTDSSGCATGTGRPDHAPCGSPADCACPLSCVTPEGGADAGQSRCKRACTVPTDCPLPSEGCFEGWCEHLDCGFLLDGGINGAIGGTCDAQGVTGACFGFFDPGTCYRPGTSSATCDTNPSSWEPARQCDAQSICYSITDGGVCETRCSLDAGADVCPPGYGCDAVAFDFTPVDEGICFPVSDAGCNVSGRALIDTICNSSADCECPTVCYHPDAGEPFCAFPCSSALDCPDPATFCRAGFCEANPCSSLGEQCDAAGVGDGVCEALGYPAQFLQCVQGGSAATACDPSASRANPAGLCAVPQLCNPRVDGGTCGMLCDPSAAASSCPAPQVCFPLVNGSFLPDAVHQGTCAACVDIQGGCDDGSECCSGVCDQTWFVCL